MPDMLLYLLKGFHFIFDGVTRENYQLLSPKGIQCVQERQMTKIPRKGCRQETLTGQKRRFRNLQDPTHSCNFSILKFFFE